MDARRTETTCVTPTCVAPRHVDASRDFFFLFSPSEQRAGGGGGGAAILLNTTYVSLLSVDCAWFLSQRYHTFVARTNPKTLIGLAH